MFLKPGYKGTSDKITFNHPVIRWQVDDTSRHKREEIIDF
jgi:hypothetical protein